ncbi:unnamed protein product [Closterium sp. NIES-54]
MLVSAVQRLVLDFVGDSLSSFCLHSPLLAAAACNSEIYVSFGGLLMRLAGDSTNLKDFHIDQRLYILIRKV